MVFVINKLKSLLCILNIYLKKTKQKKNTILFHITNKLYTGLYFSVIIIILKHVPTIISNDIIRGCRSSHIITVFW